MSFQNADSVHVVGYSTGPGKVRLLSTSVEFLKPIFFINGATKSAIFISTCSFRYNSSNRPSEINNATVIDKLHNATTTSFRNDNDSHYNSAVAEMGDHLATVDMGQKVGAAVPLSVGELAPHLI